MIVTNSELEEAWIIFRLQDDLICKMVWLTVVRQIEVRLSNDNLPTLIVLFPTNQDNLEL